MPKNQRTGGTGQPKSNQLKTKQTKEKRTKKEKPKQGKPKRTPISDRRRTPLAQRDPSPEPERTGTDSPGLMDVDRSPAPTTPPARTPQPPRRKRKLVIYSDDEDDTPVPGQGEPKRTRDEGSELMTVDVPKIDLGVNTKANRAFEELIAKPRQPGITSDNYLSELSKSVADNRPVSYVVNIILPYKRAGDIVKVVDAIMAGSEGMDDRVAFVFGINAQDTEPVKLDRAWEDAASAIARDPRPIALFKDTFGGEKFPHGTMRNGVLESPATKEVTAALYSEGTHPYISIQDFDAASRTVPSGAHVFNYFADKLAGTEDSLPIRPMMVSGGYRPGSTTKLPPKHDMEADEFATHVSEDMLTRTRLAETHPLLPYSPEPNLYIDGTLLLAGYEGIKFGPGQAEFGILSRGLNQRYAGELSKIGGTSPLEEGPETAVEDLGIPEERWVGQRTTRRTKPPSERFFDPSDVDNEEFLAQESLMDEDEDLEKRIQIDKRTSVQTFAETVRHPIRGTPFLTDFIDGAIETDLSRIAKKLDEGWSKKEKGFAKRTLAQTHVPPKTAADRIFVVKDTVQGTSLVNYGRKPRDPEPLGIRFVPTPELLPVIDEETGWDAPPQTVNNYFMRESVPGTGQVWAPTDPTSKKEVGATPFQGTRTEKEVVRTVKRGNKKVPKTVTVTTGKGDLGKDYDRLGPTVSSELSAPYARIYAGIPPSQTAISLHGVALSNPTRDTLYKLELLKTQVLGRDVLSGKPTPLTRAPVADGSLYAAVAQGIDPAPTAAQLRDLVIDTAIAKLTAEEKGSILAKQPITSFVVDHQMGSGDLTVALAQHRTWVVPRDIDELFSDTIGDFRPGDTERAQNAHALAMRLVATHLKRELHIYREDLDGPVVYAPFSAPPKGRKPDPISLNETVGMSDDSQETRTFSLRE